MLRAARASRRLIARPAPCGAEQFQSSLPSPLPKTQPAAMLSGTITRCPAWAEMAPLRMIPESRSM